ncbi:hypothetical protein HMPREF9333_00162 [Johnsonella ignava ATCC 51276]|jgi:Uncharacterized protein conserved in bacteria|uniref:UPF0297 protein HMPREF9333_00162 n=1 Tax=Johnsonella ignava ATCC 51276 TaxID=679200 RepID=G5GF24_9FIRM|nr:IreB family regulatory phosphoprotein [Johnsonella ignava]EHI56715.1 hypothetical protein HMPREF9333_00162 [Johnsonella ignava ATCC 51276]
MEDYKRNTVFFDTVTENKKDVGDVLAEVYMALSEKGYKPINQIVGYIMSGDPTYITSYKGARSLVVKVERDEILEELLKSYIKNKFRK